MAERVEKHGDVHVVVGEPRAELSAGDVCPRCGLAVQEHHFLWPKPEADVTLRLFVEACYCGVRFTDPSDQPLDETPQLWGYTGQWTCNFCGFKSDSREEYLAHSCASTLTREDPGAATDGRM